MDVHGIGMTSRRTRDRLIQRLREEGIHDERVLDAIRRVPRHVFVDEALASRAYEDTALPIGHGQTISQPYIVARMTQALIAGGRPKKVLEVGTGSGYQTAVLACLVDEIYSVERLEPLMKFARKRLREIGCRNVHIKLSDGSWGWKEHAPYDGIIVTAAAAELPPSLVEQLAPGGRLVIPVGGPAMQELLLVQQTDKGLIQERIELVNFVPLVRDLF
ncbi:MAG: protein-L-isoaspartate O-methyltransferase [Candidatus Muproteobacteria bacterium RIFCSPHIGHO2_12_FULL_60_33]|uniref:Protein-L-isoaspartate O-methyltransferase n=1 Tax=Candidatus Muproteobacteria bacterium RIFCSPLOWO2_01_FULL_60_18 TaxID=1817768 RepID=A0A1F6U4X5_9PROT|nr:MAG: protein-L-isoaspartate O-methyltransferase [Candidatus Muproteobacteria bacterium RIFCSPHIGHO2_01_60_12]OGI52359.1 MAG: protein-L-isoaspartate O-methyltransferase [Candidatus Muproteobacteria bacterium RIFCSPLOWO2_01_FULL_60_18]OGI54356.1 MAG: protein-L-isoaspartate O-methyltransferase [Candidatus Muproteobacteria bacterium RIFCSPHIGHO2_02_FULL_60_13]OGI56199.1 MAG: protein-L-isoaspartate O-methyltransferase [Candidatus Muproteobacteria bacterium RIFCSPHIGHO2_12_FULL_60_33]OGI58242.1 MA